MTAFFHTILSRLRGFFRQDALDREFDEEIEAHLAMAEEEKRNLGMSRKEARRAARLELGGGHSVARGKPRSSRIALDRPVRARCEIGVANAAQALGLVVGRRIGDDCRDHDWSGRVCLL